jgi:hypothetical protein
VKILTWLTPLWADVPEKQRDPRTYLVLFWLQSRAAVTDKPQADRLGPEGRTGRFMSVRLVHDRRAGGARRSC